MEQIVVRGAREHNLKNIDVALPRDRLVVITGLSGSGKSSLAFDTIYAEGQRRYVESLSAYARQFLEQMGKPDVDTIEGLSPAISIEQKSASRNPRSTVGTVTEIYDYLRLLFARVGKPHCWICGKPIAAQTVQQMVDKVMSLAKGTRFSVLAPIVRERKGEYRKELQELRREGFVRVSVDGHVRDLSEDIVLDKNKKHTIEVYVDRLVMKPDVQRRLTDSVELAVKLGQGLVKIAVVDGGGRDLLFSERFACINDGVSYPEITPRLFSFNNPQGACTACSGLGVKTYFDPDLIVPDPSLPVRDAFAPWEKSQSDFLEQTLASLGGAFRFDLDTPWSKLGAEARKVILNGSGGREIEFTLKRDGHSYRYKREFEGIIPILQRRYTESDSEHVREDMERFMSRRDCPDCKGTRLRAEALHVLVAGRNIHDMTHQSVGELVPFFGALELSERERTIADRILKEIRERLGFLGSVGLEYLTLDRSAATLSGGEAQRIRLATQIGSALMGVLYVLDEPSIGLHPRDNARLLATLKRLRDLGNTVLVVEHDEETIRAADYVVDMGPGAGVHGGEVVAQGTPGEIERSKESLTGQFLSGRRAIAVPAERRRPDGERLLRLRGARANNLQRVDADFPLGLLTVVTGVSGSGKSTLVVDTLLRALTQRLNGGREQTGDYAALDGVEHVDKVINIDQSPIGRTPRSNPATYTQLFGLVRDLFAQLPESKARGYKPGRYSFNVKGGRCEACEGDGIIRIEMHFLPDVFVTCEVCRGSRYNRETLEVKYKGKSIADVLAMPVDEAVEFLGNVPRVKEILLTLQEVGLGYVQLGQSATTLSGGEAQRIKLSKELARRATGRTLYLLDEPTTGLHFADVERLLHVLGRLVEVGNTVVVIEHNLDVIKTADWVIDLGPEGGYKGGRVLACGTPEEVAAHAGSYTGQFLRQVLRPARGRGAKAAAAAS
jgi:excinuclease ABC subunit A